MWNGFYGGIREARWPVVQASRNGGLDSSGVEVRKRGGVEVYAIFWKRTPSDLPMPSMWDVGVEEGQRLK